MIYGERSDRELKYAKAQAKATEFFVDSSAIPDFGMNSDELHYSSILTLSSYVDARLSGNNGEGFLLDLKKTGAFYDAASNDGRNALFSDGYWTLAMATYFLLGNYGSSKVAAGKVKNADYYGTRAGTLHGFVSYLLNPGNPIPEELHILGQYLEGGDVDEADVIEEAASLLTDANPEDLFFGGVLYVSILDSRFTLILNEIPSACLHQNWTRRVETVSSTGVVPKIAVAGTAADRTGRSVLRRKCLCTVAYGNWQNQEHRAAVTVKHSCRQKHPVRRRCAPTCSLL